MAEAYRSLLQREKDSRSKLQYGFSEYDLLAYKRLRSSSVIQHDGCINTIRWSTADNGRYMVTGSDDTSVKIGVDDFQCFLFFVQICGLQINVDLHKQKIHTQNNQS